MSDLWLWIIAATAFVLGAFYSGSETAFIAADRVRLRHLANRGNRRARRVLALIDDPEHLLSAVLVGTNLAVIGCTATSTAIAARHFGDSGATVATLVLVPSFLLFNEVIPKGLFLYYSTRAALASVDILRVLTWLLFPIVKAFSSLTDLLTSTFPTRDDAGASRMSMEELLFHIGDSREAGLISPETTALVRRAMDFKRIVVADVVTPLENVVMVDGEAPAESYGEGFSREGFSRFPVYRGARANVVGVMSVHEYMTSPDPSSLRDQLAKPYVVSLTTPITDVLLRMREQGRHMAIVEDESGRTVGMTTLEDILERFVGAITDEFH